MIKLNKYQTIRFYLNFDSSSKTHEVPIVSFVPEASHLMLINEQMYLDLQLEQIFQYFHREFFQQLLITIKEETSLFE
jgi:hypothetical protein